MPLTIERLRGAIVAVAVLLLLAIAGSFFYGRWRLRRVAQDLPERLGIQIQQSTQGFVLSKTEEGRPLFTLHAARAVEFRSGGHVTLHDVVIDLYNRQGQPDTIAGKDFEYDPRNHTVEAQGEAHLVLHAPAPDVNAGGASKDAGQVVRATTHGLIFNQTTGVARCSGEIDFAMGDFSGQAMGAEYDSKLGHLSFESNLVLTTRVRNNPAELRATRAMYDRDTRAIHLWQPRYRSKAENGTVRASSGEATVRLRGAGAGAGLAEKLEARQNVLLTTADGASVQAPAMEVLLSEDNLPRAAHFSGGVEFTDKQPDASGNVPGAEGRARDADVDFDGQGRAERVVLAGAVELQQRVETGGTQDRRTLTAQRVVLHLTPVRTGQIQLRTVQATGDAAGNAVFTSQSIQPGQTPQDTTVAARTLNASFAAGNVLRQIDGVGETRLKTVAANGDVDTSTGDTLRIEFAANESARPSGPGSRQGENLPVRAQSIRTAEQAGHVVLQQIAGGKTSQGNAMPRQAGDAATPQVATATAARAQYAAQGDTLTLTGDPVFRNAQLALAAQRMEVHRETGKMTATGGVQATVRASGGQLSKGPVQTDAGGLLGGGQPAHIIAERAVFSRAEQTAVFSGKARMWQGSNTIEAPVIELSQKMGTLAAFSRRPCEQCVVGNFLGVQASSGVDAGRKQAETKQTSTLPSTFRVVSDRLTYSDGERTVKFLGDVEVIDADGRLFAENAEVFLRPAHPPGQGVVKGEHRAESEVFGGSDAAGEQSAVEKIVATGNVRLVQPARSATGTRLVYTAADRHFVLTGDRKNPPRVTDENHGTVTGKIVTFAAEGQAIIVSGTRDRTTTTAIRVDKR